MPYCILRVFFTAVHTLTDGYSNAGMYLTTWHLFLCLEGMNSSYMGGLGTLLSKHMYYECYTCNAQLYLASYLGHTEGVKVAQYQLFWHKRPHDLLCHLL